MTFDGADWNVASKSFPNVEKYSPLLPLRAWDQTRKSVLPGRYSHLSTTLVLKNCLLKSGFLLY